MNVWILQTGEPLHSDAGQPRPMRAMNLANALIKCGHNVILWSSDFYHQKKLHRVGHSSVIYVTDKLQIRLISSPGYRRSIGFKRLLDHVVLGLNLAKMLKAVSPPDVAFVGYPPIEAASIMLRWLKTKKVPTVLDVKDQWPVIFLKRLPNWVHWIGEIVLFPYYYYARRAFNDATALCSMTDTFLDWVCKFAGRTRHSVDIVAPLTSPLANISDGDLCDAKIWWLEHGVDQLHKRCFCFIGSISRAFDFSLIHDIAVRCLSEGIDCQFIICGDGGETDKIRKLMHGLKNVIMPGWIDMSKIAVLTRYSVASLAPYWNTDDFMNSIPNKIIDSLAYKLPIITTLSGVVANLVLQNKIGYVCQSGDEMFAAVKKLISDEKLQKTMSLRTVKLYKNRFSATRVYGNLVALLERLAQC